MKTYKFFQKYNWGPGWDGELVVPNSGVFYNVAGDENWQEWYVLIPSNDINTLVREKGCAQVFCYNLVDYTIVHLDNIVADNWPDVGHEKFNLIFNNLFSNVYVYKYKQAMYNVHINENASDVDEVIESELVSPETLLACYRIKFLYSRCEIHCVRVHIKNYLDLKDDYLLDTCELRLCDIQPDRPDFFETNIKIKVTNDPSLYVESRDLVINKLF